MMKKNAEWRRSAVKTKKMNACKEQTASDAHNRRQDPILKDADPALIQKATSHQPILLPVHLVSQRKPLFSLLNPLHQALSTRLLLICLPSRRRTSITRRTWCLRCLLRTLITTVRTGLPALPLELPEQQHWVQPAVVAIVVADTVTTVDVETIAGTGMTVDIATIMSSPHRYQ
jgi:hypothetical protein